MAGPVPSAAVRGAGGRRPRPVRPRTNCAQVMALASAVGLIALVGVSMVFLHESGIRAAATGLSRPGGAVVPSAPLGLSGVARESVRFFKMRHAIGSETVQAVAMPDRAKHAVTETVSASGPGCMKISLNDVSMDRAKRLGLGNKCAATLMRAAEAQARGFSVVYEFPDGHLFADGDRYNADDMETKEHHETGHGNENRQRLMNALVRSPVTAKIAKTAEDQTSFAVGLMAAGLSEKQMTEEIRKTSVTIEGILGLVSAEAGKTTYYDTFR